MTWIVGMGLLVLVGACAPAQHNQRPFRFSYGMVHAEDPLDTVSKAQADRHRRSKRRKRRKRRKRPATTEPWRQNVVRRAEQAVGRQLTGTRRQATTRLLAAALGRTLHRTPLDGHGTLRRHDPRPGDIVVFHNGHDVNRNRKLDDRTSDAGVVIRCSRSRVYFVYLSGSRARTGVLSLTRPNLRRRRGDIINSYIRIKRSDDPPNTAYLAGQLLAGFTTLKP